MKLFLFTLLFTTTCFGIVKNTVFTTETINVAYSQGSSAFRTDTVETYGAVIVITNDNPAAGAFVASSDDTLTDAAHGFLTGLKGQVSTTTTLPGGLSAATDYFVIYQSSGVYKLATSLVNALAGTAINITDAGTGVHTFTPTALAGASAKIQESNDGTNWADSRGEAVGDLTKTYSITATGNASLSEIVTHAKYARIYYTLTAGQLSITQITGVKR